jgi:hypothetical protein
VDGFHNLSGRDSIAFQHFPDHLGDRPGGVVRGGQPFPQKKPAGSRIQDNHICKRSANVNTHLEFVRHCFVLRSFLRYELPPQFSLLSGVSPKLFYHFTQPGNGRQETFFWDFRLRGRRLDVALLEQAA